MSVPVRTPSRTVVSLNGTASLSQPSAPQMSPAPAPSPQTSVPPPPPSLYFHNMIKQYRRVVFILDTPDRVDAFFRKLAAAKVVARMSTVCGPCRGWAPQIFGEIAPPEAITNPDATTENDLLIGVVIVDHTRPIETPSIPRFPVNSGYPTSMLFPGRSAIEAQTSAESSREPFYTFRNRDVVGFMAELEKAMVNRGSASILERKSFSYLGSLADPKSDRSLALANSKMAYPIGKSAVQQQPPAQPPQKPYVSLIGVLSTPKADAKQRPVGESSKIDSVVLHQAPSPRHLLSSQKSLYSTKTAYGVESVDTFWRHRSRLEESQTPINVSSLEYIRVLRDRYRIPIVFVTDPACNVTPTVEIINRVADQSRHGKWTVSGSKALEFLHSYVGLLDQASGHVSPNATPTSIAATISTDNGTTTFVPSNLWNMSNGYYPPPAPTAASWAPPQQQQPPYQQPFSPLHSYLPPAWGTSNTTANTATANAATATASTTAAPSQYTGPILSVPPPTLTYPPSSLLPPLSSYPPVPMPYGSTSH